jgi:hypothetical protein
MYVALIIFPQNEHHGLHVHDGEQHGLHVHDDDDHGVPQHEQHGLHGHENEHRHDVLHHGQALRHVLPQGRVLRDDHGHALRLAHHRQAHHRQAHHRQGHHRQALRGDQVLRIRDAGNKNIEQNPS